MKIKKKCIQCGIEFESYKCQNRKFCSKKCKNLFQVGKIPIKAFTARIGNGSWNKGLTKYTDNRVFNVSVKLKKTYYRLTDDQKRKISDSRIGKTFEEFLGREGSIIAKRRMSEKQSGYNHPNWKGGVTPISLRLRNHTKYKKWVFDVFDRDLFTCQECGDNKGGNLNAHHYKKLFCILVSDAIAKNKNVGKFNACLKYKPLWDISNGRTLCEDCHIKKHRKEINNAYSIS